MTTEPYQVMPALDDDQLHALRQSIRQHGILQPIEVDQDGAILDGHHRARIADELGIDCPQRVVSGLVDDDEKRQYALTVNVARRHLTQAKRAELVAMLRGRGLSQRAIGSALGIGVGTVNRTLAAGVPSGTPDKVTGADGKTYAATRPQPTTQPEPDDECEQSRTDAEPDDQDQAPAGTCEACHQAMPPDEWGRGFRRCDECDSEGEHVSPDGPDGACRLCAEAAAAQHPATPAERIEGVADAAPDYVQPADTTETPARRDSDPIPPGPAVATTGGPGTTLNAVLAEAVDKALAKAEQDKADRQALEMPRDLHEQLMEATDYVVPLSRIETRCQALVDAVDGIDPDKAVADLPPDLLHRLDVARQAHAYLTRVVDALNRIGVPA